MAETADMADAQEVNLRPDADNPQPANLTWPQDWKTRFDRPSDDLVVIGDSSVADPDVFFTNMKPGWHITSKRPAGIYWNPNSTASGDYSVSSNIFLFDPGTRNEAFGLFVGGSDLNGESQSYLYFLIRKTGEYLVKVRKGEETENVVGWTANEVIVPMQAHFLALQGLSKLFETVQLIRNGFNSELTVTGMVLCMHDKQTILAGEVVNDLNSFLDASKDSDVPWNKAIIFNPPIRRNIKLAESPSFGKTIFEYAPTCPGSRDYQKLAESVIDHTKMPD